MCVQPCPALSLSWGWMKNCSEPYQFALTRNPRCLTRTGMEQSETAGFLPIIGPQPRVLVLGSLPGVKSVEKQQYYGHPQNAFWRIMSELFGTDRKAQYAERVEAVIRHHIAIWDVLAASVRPGSMDSAIVETTARPNNFARLFSEQPDISLVCFNGQTAARLFHRLVAPTLGKGSNSRRYHVLPSTSSAYANMTFDEKLEHWRVVQDTANRR